MIWSFEFQLSRNWVFIFMWFESSFSNSNHNIYMRKVLWVLFFFFSKKKTIVNKNLYIHFKYLYWWAKKGSITFHFSNNIFSFSKCVHLLQIALLMGLWKNNEIYIKLLNLFQLSRIYSLLYLPAKLKELKKYQKVVSRFQD